MQIRQLMTTSPIYCLPTDSASKAALMMNDIDVGILPIVDTEETRKLIGVVTDRDLCLEVVAKGLDPLDVHVLQCMTRNLVCCEPDDDMQKALQLMRENQIRRIPVVDKKGVIQGMVSLADLLGRGTIVSAAEIEETLKKITEPTSEASKPRAYGYRKSA